MKTSIIFVLLCAVNVSLADDKQILLNDINQITRDIRSELLQTEADESTLEEVKEKLEEALSLITQGAGSGGRCYEFAYEKYYISLNSTQAADRAIQTCKKIKDVAVAKFAYEKYYISLNSTQAMDRAADVSGADLKGKYRIIQFAYEKYYISLNSTQAMDRATQKAALVPSNTFSCVQQTYDAYYVQQSALNAMDRAFEKCAE